MLLRLLACQSKQFAEELPEGGVVGSARSYLRVGCTDQGRPFKGMLTDVNVAEPAE